MKKYIQKVIPEVSTEKWTKFKTAKQTRDAMFDYAKKYIDNIVINKDLNIKVRFNVTNMRKTSHGGRIYPKKACLIEIIDKLIMYAKKSNWGWRKDSDDDSVIGYINFKVKAKIDNELEFIHLAVKVTNDGYFHYDVSVNKWI